MSFSQTLGRAHEIQPVFSAGSSEDERGVTVPASALCASNQDRPRANYSQLLPLARPSYSPAALMTKQAFARPVRAADE